MRKSNAAVRSLLALALSACGAQETATDAELPVATNQAAPSLEALAKQHGLTEIGPGQYAHEDMVLSGEQVRGLFGGTRGALIVQRGADGVRDLWSPAARRDLRYCVSDNLGDAKERVVAGMERATRAWSREAGIGVTFRYVPAEDGRCTTGNLSVHFPVRLEPTIPATLLARASIGRNFISGDREAGFIELGPRGARLGDAATGVDLKSTLVHELGHLLGLYHEHDHPASLPSGCGDGSFDGSHEILTPYDPTSVMHYIGSQDPRCPGVSYMWLSASDKQAARQLYPGGAVTESACFHRFYGRGAGTTPDTCNGERNGAICYPRCNPGFYGAGPVCWQACPAGYVDDGLFCRRPFPLHIFAKGSYGRGAGIPLSCRAGLQMDGGLCYQPCAAGFNGAGPVCHEGC